MKPMAARRGGHPLPKTAYSTTRPPTAKHQADSAVTFGRRALLTGAGGVLTVAHELGLIAGFTAMFAAVLAVLAVLRHSTVALGMRAFCWVRHRLPPDLC